MRKRKATSGLILAVLLLLWAVPARAGSPAHEALFPLPEKSGQVKISLLFNRAVLGKKTVVGFGAPFPPGFVGSPGEVCLLGADGGEVPVFARSLLVWPSGMPGGGSQRSVFLQFEATPVAESAEYTLCWGRKPARSLAKGWPARTGWIPVQGPDFPGVDISDPPAFAVYPPQWLGKCLLKGRINPAGSDKDFALYDRAIQPWVRSAARSLPQPLLDHKDFKRHYLSEAGPWLYDRSATFFVLYFRSGLPLALLNGHRNAQYFAWHATSEGPGGGNPELYDKLHKKRDSKYGNQEGFLFDYMLTGDDTLLKAVPVIFELARDWPSELASGRGFWTERHAGLGLLNAITAYEILGDEACLELAREYFGNMYRAQQEPLSGAPNLGCMIHTAKQHGESKSTGAWVCSPWMSSLAVDAALRYYVITGDEKVEQFCRTMARYVREHGTYISDMFKKKVKNFDEALLPYYLASTEGPVGESSNYGNMQHTLDVSLVPALGYYFAGGDSQARAESLQLFTDLKKVWDLRFKQAYYTNYKDGGKWVKGAEPYAIIRPSRSFAWRFRTTAGMDWYLRNAVK